MLTVAIALALAAQAPAATSTAADRAARYEQLHQETGNSALLWLIAEAHAQAGNADEAVRYTAQAAEQKLGFQVTEESPLSKLKGRPDFDALVARLDRDGRRPGGARTARRLAVAGVVPEGIAADQATGTLYVGDMAARRVLALSDSGERVLATTGELQPLGMKVDRERGLLWVAASNAFLSAVREPRSALLAFDLTTGRQVRSITSPELRSINDLVVLPGGEIYVTDSLGGAVFRHRSDGEVLERVTPASQMSYPNGIAASPDGRSIYVAQGLSLRRIDPGTGAVQAVSHGADLALISIDGLYWHDGGLIAVQNSGNRGRILRLHLSDMGDAITGHEIIEAAHPDFDIPTTGTILGDRLLVIANSQLDQIQDDGSVAGAVKPVVLLEWSLSKAN